MQSTLTKLFETLKSTLASGIDVGHMITNFDFFSPGLMTLLESTYRSFTWLFNLILFAKLSRPYVYSLPYVYSGGQRIPPSSIESERTFSVTGFCITKFGCSLGHLVFLKHIFQKEEQEEILERIELLHRQATKLIKLIRILSVSTKKYIVLVSWSREVSSKKLARVSVS